MKRFKPYFQRGRAQVLLYDPVHGQEIKEFRFQQAAKAYIRSFEHRYKKYGWRKAAAGTNYDHIYFIVHKNDHINYQRKPILVYKQADSSRILPFVPEDLDHLNLAFKYARAVGVAAEALRDSLNPDIWDTPLKILRELADEIPTLDGATVDYVDPWTFFNQVLDTIARAVRSSHYAKAVLAVMEYVAYQKSIEETVSMLNSFDEYTKPEQVNLDAANEFFDLGLDEFDCFKQRTGVCSLMLSENEFEQYAESEARRQSDENSVHYCRHMLMLMQKNGTPPIHAHRNMTCNHISLTDGQHRSCISKTMSMALPAELSSQHTYCSSCTGKRRAFKDDRYYLL